LEPLRAIPLYGWLMPPKSPVRVTTLEIDEQRTLQAKHYAKELELDHVIDFWVGDAQHYLEKCHGKYDFILLDAERDAYLNYWVFYKI
jgi:predicted O-methyltransferase YrrM